jgi:hypothetical protein
MTTVIELWCAIAPLGWVVACWVAIRMRQIRAEAEGARRDLEAADAVGEGLCREIASLRESLEGAHAQLVVLERNNYELACQLHGKAAVDKAIADARERGTN